MLRTNQYFNGNVVSIGFQKGELPATLGVMAPGEYEFGTNKRETMTVVCGVLTVKLPGADDWQTFQKDESFVVEANNSFDLRVSVDTAYLCTYE